MNISIQNDLQCALQRDEPLPAIVNNLTYVRVGNKWPYLCLFVDLFNLEVIGPSADENKTANLVYQALASIQLFHTDRNKEVVNQLISVILKSFGI